MNRVPLQRTHPPRETIPSFVYTHESGPFASLQEMQKGFKTGNSRRAVQAYFWYARGAFIPAEDILSPEMLGKFIPVDDENNSFESACVHDVIYAERRNKASKTAASSNNGALRMNWHSAVFLGHSLRGPCRDLQYLYHSSIICGGSATWTTHEFLDYYQVRGRLCVDFRRFEVSHAVSKVF
ncbi:MAG: hypothetical protein IPL87_00185 [Candidatus Moraniibacteriota bacterium]|nr:MAG: hypothetical protein IPL87_00185 [Candidatus Moranbacteria bacterium]